jgi:DNA-binding NarL/FixJ family response regulator
MENHDLIKVLLVDDHISVTYTLALALNVPPIRVVDVAGSAAEAIKLSHKVSPDVVVMDVRLSDDTGINATAGLRDRSLQFAFSDTARVKSQQ